VRALVVGNGDDLDPGFIGHRLREHGYAFTECHREHPDRWPDLDGTDLVLTLGSEWNVYRAETAHLVEAEAALIRRVVADARPLIAICFGAQVLSHALGGAVTRMGGTEIGWFDVEVTAPDVPATGPWLEWHDDAFTVPEGFDQLARRGVGPQLIRSRRVVGTQFHPEVTETMVARWLGHGGAEQVRNAGGDPDELLAATRRETATSHTRAGDLVDWFLSTL
jgi:GMP synthase-like glutamine amidotransferase